MEFNGAALYTAEEIKSALNKHSKLVDVYNKQLRQAEVRYLEDNKDKRYWCCFILPLKRSNYDILYEDVSWISKWESLYDKLKDLGYIEATFPDNFLWVGKPRALNLHIQVKNLTNGGKDCYLNPDQAWFVNKYK